MLDFGTCKDVIRGNFGTSLSLTATFVKRLFLLPKRSYVSQFKRPYFDSFILELLF